jgi:hypothetical protein
VKKFKNTRAVITTCLTLAVAAGVAYGGTSLTVGHSNSQKFFLRSASQFSITGTVTASATSQSPALLYPGVTRYFRYQVTNPFSIPITVTSMRIASVTPPNGCPVTNLDDSGTSFAGSLLVGAGATSEVAEPISLGSAGNQDACEAGTFSFTFEGAASYTDSTTTVLASGTNPSSVGGSVTLTATVTAADQSLDTSSPSGTVEFYSCATSDCSAPTALGTGTLGSGTATFSTSSLSSGTDYLEATYEGVTNYFSTSTSNVVSQVVSGATHPSVVSLRSMDDPAAVGSPVMYVAQVSGGGASTAGAATGTVTFKDFGSPISSCANTAISSGLARCTATYPAMNGSPHQITATYSGDTFYMASTSSMLSEKVVRAAPGNAVELARSVVVGGTLHFIARVSGHGSTMPTGNVRWHVATPAGVRGCALTSALTNGITRCSIVATKAGRYVVSEVYAGDANYVSAASSNSRATVARAKPNGVVTNTVPSSRASRVTFRATISGRGARPTGSVTWRVSGTAGDKTCAVSTTTLVAGSATCTIDPSKRGTYAVAVLYRGNANYRSITTRTDTLS